MRKDAFPSPESGSPRAGARFARRVATAFVSAFLLASGLAAQAPTGNLLGFESLIGGQWWLGDDSYQEFEWAVGQQMVKSRAYFVLDETPTLVSEGVWFWHPGEEAVRGYHVAVEMPVHFFDYTTRFEGNTLVSDLVSYGEMGATYRETFEFTGPDTYVWTLYQDGERAMGGTYHRRRP